MDQEIEIEYKNLLTKEEFHYLLTHFPFSKKAQKQTNYYFETNDFSLKKKNSALRIRNKGNTYQLTLKEPHPEGLLETHDRLTKQEALAWINGKIIKKKNTTKQLLDLQISPNSLKYFGYLTTERREMNYQDVLLVLDYSIYNGHEDYELELEAPNQEIGWHTFTTLLKDHTIKKKHTLNKIERFFSTLEK